VDLFAQLNTMCNSSEARADSDGVAHPEKVGVPEKKYKLIHIPPFHDGNCL
jgi:hypothetical protein